MQVQIKNIDGENAIENAAHIMGRINTAVVHETAVMEEVDDFQYFEDQLKVAEKLGSCTRVARNQRPMTVILGIVLAI